MVTKLWSHGAAGSVLLQGAHHLAQFPRLLGVDWAAKPTALFLLLHFLSAVEELERWHLPSGSCREAAQQTGWSARPWIELSVTTLHSLKGCSLGER